MAKLMTILRTRHHVLPPMNTLELRYPKTIALQSTGTYPAKLNRIDLCVLEKQVGKRQANNNSGEPEIEKSNKSSN